MDKCVFCGGHNPDYKKTIDDIEVITHKYCLASRAFYIMWRKAMGHKITLDSIGARFN